MTIDTLAARVEKVEHGHKNHESGVVMTNEQLARMNVALSVPKDKNYRPYCLASFCALKPRLVLRTYGFECWSCGNKIDFNLVRINK